MIGITKDIQNQYNDAELARLFGSQAFQGEVSVVYENGDRTCVLPSSQHRRMVDKGWRAVEIYNEPTPEPEAPADLSDAIVEHARHDRTGEWTRGTDKILSSCRNAANLLRKGYTFAGLADEVRLRAIAEARPL